MEQIQSQESTLAATADVLKADSHNILDKAVALVEKNKQLDKQLNELKAQLASQARC